MTVDGDMDGIETDGAGRPVGSVAPIVVIPHQHTLIGPGEIRARN